MGYNEDYNCAKPWSVGDSAPFSLMPTMTVMHYLSRTSRGRSCASQMGPRPVLAAQPVKG